MKSVRNVIRYRSARAVMAAFSVANPAKYDSAHFSEVVAEEKCWGWVNWGTRVIHYWVARDASMEALRALFAHELGHIADLNPRKRPRGFPASEWRAEQYADVALEAERLARKAYRGKK